METCATTGRSVCIEREASNRFGRQVRRLACRLTRPVVSRRELPENGQTKQLLIAPCGVASRRVQLRCLLGQGYRGRPKEGVFYVQFAPAGHYNTVTLKAKGEGFSTTFVPTCRTVFCGKSARDTVLGGIHRAEVQIETTTVVKSHGITARIAFVHRKLGTQCFREYELLSVPTKMRGYMSQDECGRPPDKNNTCMYNSMEKRLQNPCR